MAARFDLVTLNSPRTDHLATFWCAAVGLHESTREDEDRWIVLADEGGVQRIGLQRGDVRLGTVHLDLACSLDEFDDELERLLVLGATEVEPPRREPYGMIVNLADPDGNAFDLCAYA
ncbi:MAG: VOC family protein [Ilumatobacteraceae bacterium]